MSLAGIPELGQAGPVDMDLAGTFTQELELR
jgi:hypothetical protein